MDGFKLVIPEIKPIYNFTIIYKGKDGIIEIKTSKQSLLEKLQFFDKRRNELLSDEFYIHDEYDTDIFKSFIESIISSELIINKNNISKYYELSCKYQYQELQNRIKKFNQERPDFLEIADQISFIEDQDFEREQFVISQKEELIAQNLDKFIHCEFLKKLPIAVLTRILNSPKRPKIDHSLLFDFVVDRIRNHEKYRAKTDEEENLSILTCCLDYMEMSESEIIELLSLEQDMSVLHPINSEKRLKVFINESAKNQQKISELETMLRQLNSKLEVNENKISDLEKKVIPKLDANENKIVDLEQKLISKGKYMQVQIKKCNIYHNVELINIKSTDKIRKIIEKYSGNGIYDLYYNGILLNQYLTLEDYLIPDHSIIHVLENRNTDNITVFIKTISSDYIPISIDPNSEVDNLIDHFRITSLLFDDKQKLIYEGKELSKGKKLQGYSISDGSVISIIPSITKIDINVHFFRYEQLKNIFSININLTDKIQNICNICSSNETNEIVLIFNGERLDKNKNFQDYSITNGSDIFLYQKYKELYAEFYGINIPGNSTIKDLKLKYQEEKGIPIDEQRLFIGHKELDDNEPFSFYSSNMRDIKYYHLPKGNKLIFVKCDTNIGSFNDIFIFKDTILVRTIRESLCSLACISCQSDTPLVYNGEELDENKTLKDYNIPHESESRLTFNFYIDYCSWSGVMEIYVRTDRRTLMISCNPYDTINIIKLKINEMLDYPREYRLLFCCRYLSDDSTIQDNSITKYSTLKLINVYRG